MVYFTKYHFKSLTFFFLVESKRKNTKIQMPTLIQEFYVSVYVQIKMIFFVPYFFNTMKKQNVLIRLFTI